MNLASPITNKVAESGLITLDLSKLLPKYTCTLFDLKPFLFKELIIKEKDFRSNLKAVDWSQFEGQYVGIICSADALIPHWAYMLVVTYLQPIAANVVLGDNAALEVALVHNAFSKLNLTQYEDKRIVIKGCGETIPVCAYTEITRLLQPIAKSIMYGEPCSTVPIYKNK